jgi:hypothetical protein
MSIHSGKLPWKPNIVGYGCGFGHKVTLVGHKVKSVGHNLQEVKTREGSSFEDDLRKHGVAESLIAHGYTNSVSGLIGDAVEQLDSTLEGREEHRLIWCHGLDEDECEQVRKTLYGIVTVVRPSATSAESLDCLYLTLSEFFRYPQLARNRLSYR